MMSSKVMIVIRCPVEGCPEHGKEKWVRVPREFVGDLSKPGANDQIVGTCGHVWSLSLTEKADIARSIEEGKL
jgi:hypothetical protein